MGLGGTGPFPTPWSLKTQSLQCSATPHGPFPAAASTGG